MLFKKILIILSIISILVVCVGCNESERLDTLYGTNHDLSGWLKVGDYIEWTGGNVIYVPLDGDIQTYVNNAEAGDTLILASGVYNITDVITINKQLNIIGQGNAGFATSPISPSHGTLISSSTSLPLGALNITNDNVRIAHLSLNLTGAASVAINAANNLKGIVLQNIDVIVNCAGYAQGFTIYGSDAVLRDLTFYIKSTNDGASGLWCWNDSSTTQNAVIDCFNVTGTVQGANTYGYAFVCENIDDDNTITINLSNSVCRTLGGTPLDIAVASISTTTNNAIINAYMCTFDGADYDAYQSGTNQLNVGGSVLVNNKVFGIVTYRAAMVAGLVIASLEGYSVDLVQTYINGISENDTVSLVFDFEPSKIDISYSAICHHENYPYQVGHTTGHSIISITGVDTITINTNYTAICDYDGVIDSAILHSNVNVLMAAGGYDGLTFAKCWGIGTWDSATHTLTITFNDVKHTWDASNFIELVATAYR